MRVGEGRGGQNKEFFLAVSQSINVGAKTSCCLSLLKQGRDPMTDPEIQGDPAGAIAARKLPLQLPVQLLQLLPLPLPRQLLLWVQLHGSPEPPVVLVVLGVQPQQAPTCNPHQVLSR